MEYPDIIESKKADQPADSPAGNEHAEAVALVEKHRDFFEHYAKGRIKIEPAPAGIPTFAFNLEENTIYINSMFYRQLGLSEEKTVWATLHEIEHFLEKLQILAEDGGERSFGRYLERVKSSRAFSLMDNCVADIRENRTIVTRTNKGMAELEVQTYKEDLFPSSDFSKQPGHIQLSQALLREARVPSEKCVVSPEVRSALDQIASVPGLMDIMTNPETPMSLRLRLQNKYIWPQVEKLMEQDIEDKKNPPKGGPGQPGEPDEPQQSGGESGEGDKNDDQQDARDKEKDRPEGDRPMGGKRDKKPGDQDKTDQDVEGQADQEGQEGESKPGGKGKKSKAESGKEQKAGGSGSDESAEDKTGKEDSGEGRDETDPDKIFAEDYAEAEKNFPAAVPLEEIEKAFQAWKEAKKGQNSGDRADAEYAEKIGVDKKDLQDYRKMVEELEKIVNPETDVTIIEELRLLFSRIISKRLKVAMAPQYPVEEGDELVDPAQLVADVRSGNLQPKVWEDTDIREKKGDRYGEVEITLVCDRSSSMEHGQKAVEQRRAAVLVMEVLKEFAELCEEEKRNIDHPLEVKSEIYSFASSTEDSTPLKKMSAELGEAERIGVLKKLHNLPGSTTDFACLEAIDSQLDEATINKIKIGELKKIVIVFTDGGSDDAARVQGVLKSLRDSGVVAIGVGITSAGEPVLTTYAPNALVVEDVQQLPLVLGRLLKEHLKDI